MKTFKILIITWIVLFVLFYLSGSFSQATFNLSLWNPDVRLGIAVGYLCVSVISTLGISLEMIPNKNNYETT